MTHTDRTVRSDQVDALLSAAFGQADQASRAEWLRRACGADDQLLAETLALLANFGPDGELKDPVLNPFPPTAVAAAAHPPDMPQAEEGMVESVGDVIGGYTLLERIGEGGFGVVFLAAQAIPARHVALKVIKPGMDTRAVVARFEAERQALGQMDHPNIARIFDAGETRAGRPYFVMELVHGPPITEFCDKNRLDTGARIALLARVCRAVHHAYGKGFVHRDLKPSNILVTRADDGTAVPKVIDFGIAKVIEGRPAQRPHFTPFRQLVGTPEYMSPEQADFDGSEVDTRSDVYSLGVVLYELLVGATPLDGRALRSAADAAMRKMIREVDPPKPSARVGSLGDAVGAVAENRGTDPVRLKRLLRGEVDWVVMRALEKDRNRRYDTAAMLADDLDRHLAGDAVTAGPASRSYLAGKFVRRHKLIIGTAAVIAIALLGGTGATTAAFFSERHQRRIADAQRSAADAARASAETERQRADVQRVKADRMENSARATVNFLTTDVFGPAMPGRTSDRAVRETLVKTVIEPAMETVDTRFQNQPEARSAVQYALAGILQSLGRSDLALPLARAAFKTRQGLYGDDAVDTLASAQQVAWDLKTLGRFADAVAIYQPLIRRLGGPGADGLFSANPILLGAFDQYASLLSLQGYRDRAEQLYKEALARDQRLLGDDGPQTIEVLTDYATSLLPLGRAAEAEPLARQAMERSRRVSGENSLAAAAAEDKLALVLLHLGRTSEAEPLVRHALEQYRRVMGDDHPTTVTAETELTILLVSSNQFAKAEQSARPLLERCRRLWGENDQKTVIVMEALAESLMGQNRFADAEPLSRAVFQWYRSRIGENQPQTITARNEYALVLRSLGRTADAGSVMSPAPTTRP
jgi:serine/threonine protein kinase/tetratricopeptide (TPR) repeat protein